MSSLNPLLRIALAVVFVCVNGSRVAAAEQTRIEPVVTSNGAIVLQIAKLEGGGSLTGIQEYAVMVSDDLVNWEEIARSRLLEELQVVDLERGSRPARFYKIVGIDLDESVRVFAEGLSEDLSEVRDFTSGIVLEGISLADYEEVEARLAEIRAEIVELLDSGALVPESLLVYYRESSGEIDRMMAAQPLLLEWEGDVYEIELSRAMAALNEQYARLDEVSLQDYDRLLGVDEEDLEGLESLVEYVERRQVGMQSSLPLFDAISPRGQFELTTRLLLRHLDVLSEERVDSDKDGLWEIDYLLYGRLLNGLERLKRVNESLADAAEAETPVSFAEVSSGRVLTEALERLLSAIDRRQRMLEESVWGNVDSKEIDEAFESQARSEALNLIVSRRNLLFGKLESSLLREGLEMELFPEFELGLDQGEVRFGDLEQALAVLLAYGDTARSEVAEMLERLELDDVVRTRFVSVLERALNGYWAGSKWGSGIFQKSFGKWRAHYLSGELLFETEEGAHVKVSPRLLSFLDELPRSIDTLVSYPGIGNMFTRSELESFLSEGEYSDLYRIRLDPDSESTLSSLSEYAVKAQLVQAILELRGGEVLDEGVIDLVLFGREVLFEDSQDGLVERIDAARAKARDELQGLNDDPLEGGSWRTFYAEQAVADELLAALNEVVRDESVAARSLEQYFLVDLARERWEEIWEVLASRWGVPSNVNLWGGTSEVPSREVEIVLEGRIHTFSTHWLREVFWSALNRVAVPRSDDVFLIYQWARLNGFEETELLEVAKVNAYGPNPWMYWGVISFDGEQGVEDEPNRYEMFLGFLPRWLESLDADEVLEGGVLSAEKIESVVTRELAYAVAAGESISGLIEAAEYEELNRLYVGYKNAVFNHWGVIESLEGDYIALKRRLAEAAEPIVKHLSEWEMYTLSNGRAHRDLKWQIRRLWDLSRAMPVVSLKVGEERWTVDFRELAEWQERWLWGVDEYLEAYPGLVDSDFVDSRVMDYGLRYSASGVLEEDDLYEGKVDMRKLVVAALRRIAGGGEGVPDLYRDSIVVENKVNAETLRRLFRAVDTTHEDVLRQAHDLVADAMIRIGERSRYQMTIANLEGLYEEILSLRAALVALVEEETRVLAASDAVEIEEAVTGEYRVAFDVLFDYLRERPLVVEVGGELKDVQFEEVKPLLIETLQRRFPGEDLAAYHFASFYGISVGDLRRFDKLEQFLNVQIVAVPRNSQYVEVVSKLSDIGLRQFVALMVSRFGEAVYDESLDRLDFEALVEIASDEETGIERATSRVGELFASARAEIDAIDEPGSLEGLEGMVEVLSRNRELIRVELMGEITALSDVGAEQVREVIALRNEELVSRVGEIVFGKKIQFEAIDGSGISIDMSLYEGELVEALNLALDGGDAENSSEELWMEYRLEIYLLVARLAYAYGDFVLDEGSFSVERFAENLQVQDSVRMELFAEEAFVEELVLLEAAIPEDEGRATRGEVSLLGDQLSESRPHFMRLHERSELYGIDVFYRFQPPVVLEKWWQLVGRYETRLQESDLIVSDGEVSVTLPVVEMARVVGDALNEGDLPFLDQYADEGETRYEYGRFRNLMPPRNAVGLDYSLSAISAGLLRDRLELPTWGWIPDESENEAGAFSRFARLPGVLARDVRGLELGDWSELKVPSKRAIDLMKGQLNLRTLNPGSGIDLFQPDWELGGDRLSEVVVEPEYESGFFWLSWRDQRFRVFVEVLLDYWDLLVDENGAFQMDVFETLIRTEVDSDEVAGH
ncbi:hypothetical protein [Pelagicoccus mobilis]|uniref:Uncharacterized protein n=1 Tax=Pelagicoccus mobilis TaxID=415221 RepID=A0A934VR18_9BACT|nr:hypothetical protein [Pelagicoccus mobilis]MBK1878932.1 hypothetical protein [Pelagicoccus mobilis]